MTSTYQRRLIKVLFVYSEDVTPPRCRKSLTELRYDGEVFVGIPELTASHAPVALKATMRERNDDGLWTLDYRWFGGSLWEPAETRVDGSPRHRDGSSIVYWPALPDVIDLRRSSDNCCHELGFWNPQATGNLAQTEEDIRGWAEGFIIVDGQCYRPTFERSYQISTFGLDGDQGSAGVFLVAAGNGGREFSLLERERALEEGTRVALARGNTKCLPMAVNADIQWEVLMPEVLTVPSGMNAYRVHLYAVARVAVEVDSAATQLEAVDKAVKGADLNRTFRGVGVEYADEIVGVMVDEVGDSDYRNTRSYDPGVKPGQAPWVPAKVVAFPREAELSSVIGVSEPDRETVFPQSLEGYAALAAVKELESSWSDALLDGFQGNLLADLDATIALLNRFKEVAKGILPPHTTKGA